MPNRKREKVASASQIVLPRLILIGCTASLVGLGLVMVFSASSITDLVIGGESIEKFIGRQLVILVIGLVLAAVAAALSYRIFNKGVTTILWWVSLAALIAVFALGRSSHGATRWIYIGGFTIQPSEFVKLSIVLVCASLFPRYFETKEIDKREFLKRGLLGVGILIALILFQPDKGSSLVIGLTVIVLLYICGVPGKFVLCILGGLIAIFLLFSLKDEYSRTRLLTMFDPFADKDGAGYQLTRGFYSFGSGSLFGVGIGNGSMKYSYLPEADNDFILAVIGEEMGLFGCLVVLALFGGILYSGVKIAEYAPDLQGRIVAVGCTCLIIFQAALNVCGVVGVFPLSGKPIPFLSSGGSSLMASLLIVGMLLSVSLRTNVAESLYQSRRDSFSIVDKDTPRPSVSEKNPNLRLVSKSSWTTQSGRKKTSTTGVSEARTRTITAKKTTQMRSTPLAPSRTRANTPKPSVTISHNADGRERINIGQESASERLRKSSGPILRGSDTNENPARHRTSNKSASKFSQGKKR